MSWPGWDDVLPALVAVVGAVAALAGLTWTLGRIFRPWMREAARGEAERVSAEVKALANKLETNDFPHLEARIEKRFDRSDARIEKRFDGIEKRFDRIEEILVKLVGRFTADSGASPSPK